MKTKRVNRHTKPPVGGMGGSIHDWERAKDPWHTDAFPTEFKHAAPHKGKRKKGWMALDGFGNPILFLADGLITPY